MLHVRPPSLDEIENLEHEVFKELDGVESSFTTQRKVFQFLIQDYETSNASLQREQQSCQKAFDRLSEMEGDIRNLSNEIVELHQLVIFLGNQLNRRISLGSSSLSSTSTQDESLILDEMMEDLLHSSSPKLPKRLERSEINKVSISPQPKVTSRNTSISQEESNNELIATLTENLMLKDKLIEHLEEKINVQSVKIRKVHDEKVYGEVTIAHLLNIIQHSTSHHSVFAAKSFDNVHAFSVKSNASETPKSSHLLNIKDQLAAVRKEEHSRFLSGTSHRRCLETKSSIKSSIPRKIMDRYGYKGGGLGKNEDGITSPIAARRQIRFASSPTTSPSAEVTHEQHEKKPWPTGTTLIIGDSMVSGISERGLKNYNGKVSCQPGATIQDMYDYVRPLLKKKPDNIILHVSTNDAPYKPSNQIVNELSSLRSFIETSLPSCKVFISSPIFRTDHKLANSTIRQVNKKLKLMDRIIINDAMNGTCLGRKGLHLNKEGSRRLARNFISHMQSV